MLKQLRNMLPVWKNQILYRLMFIRRLRRRKYLREHFRGVSVYQPIPYRYSAGAYGSIFFEGLKEGKILASRCPECKTTLVPCRMVCGSCFSEMDEIVEVSPRGRIVAYTQVSFPFIDPFTGHNRKVPYCYAMIRFDGADNTFQGLLNVRYHHKIRPGMMVQAEFRKKRQGCLDDIRHFRVLKST